MEKQTRTNKYRNLRTQLKKESTYLDDTQVLQTAVSKGIIRPNVDAFKPNDHAVNSDLIEKTINEIKNDILNNPGKTPEEIESSMKMLEERVTTARRSTTNVESIVQQINAWQKSPPATGVRPSPRVNTITNSTRSTTMLNAVNVDLTVDDLIRARQEVVEKLKNNPGTSKSTFKFDENIVARVNNPPVKSKLYRKKSFKLMKMVNAFIISVLILILIIGIVLLVGHFVFPDTVKPVFEWLKKLFNIV